MYGSPYTRKIQAALRYRDEYLLFSDPNQDWLESYFTTLVRLNSSFPRLVRLESSFTRLVRLEPNSSKLITND